MSECSFFDDEQPTPKQANELPHWVSITRLSNLLGVSRNTISTTVKRAWANREPWVKKEKAENRNIHYYVINTQSEMYLCHLERWTQNKTLPAALVGDDAMACPHTDHQPFLPPSSGHVSFPSHTTVLPGWHGQQSSGTVLQQWPRFRQWLYSQGIQVFQNLLADERQKSPWEWRWGDFYGKGCKNEEDAIIAALQSRLEVDEEAYEVQGDSSFLQMIEQQELQKPQPKYSWFRKNN